MAQLNSTILDRIWLNGTNDYQQRIPRPTQGNIAATQAALFAPENIDMYNQFVSALVNRIGATYVHQQQWKNPLAVFKKEGLRYGDTAQEIATKWIKAHSYRDDAVEVFKMHRPDAEVWYHKVNRRDYYPITVNDEELEFAFTDDYGLNAYIASIMAAPQNSDEYDEYRIMMQLLAHYEDNFGFFKHQLSAAPTDLATAQEFLIAVRAFAKKLKFPSALYNAGVINDIPVFANPNELVLMMTPDTEAVIDVKALAAAFNRKDAEIQERIVDVDEFPVPNAVACLTTQAFFQCRDKLNRTTSQYNALTLGTNYFLHRWGSYSVSPFVPAIMFTTEQGTSVTVVEMELTAISLSADADVSPVAGAEVPLSVELTGTLDPATGTPVELAPDAAVYTVDVTRTVGDDTQAVNSPRTYVDEYGVLHISKSLETGDVITVTAKSTYVNPSGATTPLTDSIEVEVA